MRRIFRHIFGAVFLGVLALGAVSCEEEPLPPTIELVLGDPSVSSRKGSQFLWVYAPGKWELSTDADWITITPSKGRGDNRAVAMMYAANTEEGPRSADIVLTTAEDEIRVVTLRQNAPSDDPEPEINGGSSTRKGWMELPETRTDDGLNVFWHNMTVGSYTGRNYSFYWDYSKLVAHWVAYPLNSGLRSSGSRSDAWALDPLLPSQKQPNVTSTYRNGWARGHQIPSADRLSYNANVQTFYGTNMTPQDYNFNGEIWARLEDKVRTWSNRCDTLYVVTGCVVDETGGWTTDIDGKRIAVPVAYYKAVLGYTKSESANGGYRACGVYLPHSTPSSQTVGKNHSSVMSVRALEKILGYDLFVNLPGAIGAEAAAAVETEDPNTVNWWWN